MKAKQLIESLVEEPAQEPFHGITHYACGCSSQCRCLGHVAGTNKKAERTVAESCPLCK